MEMKSRPWKFSLSAKNVLNTDRKLNTWQNQCFYSETAAGSLRLLPVKIIMGFVSWWMWEVWCVMSVLKCVTAENIWRTDVYARHKKTFLCCWVFLFVFKDLIKFYFHQFYQLLDTVCFFWMGWGGALCPVRLREAAALTGSLIKCHIILWLVAWQRLPGGRQVPQPVER